MDDEEAAFAFDLDGGGGLIIDREAVLSGDEFGGPETCSGGGHGDVELDRVGAGGGEADGFFGDGDALAEDADLGLHVAVGGEADVEADDFASEG